MNSWLTGGQHSPQRLIGQLNGCYTVLCYTFRPSGSTIIRQYLTRVFAMVHYPSFQALGMRYRHSAKIRIRILLGTLHWHSLPLTTWQNRQARPSRLTTSLQRDAQHRWGLQKTSKASSEYRPTNSTATSRRIARQDSLNPAHPSVLHRLPHIHTRLLPPPCLRQSSLTDALCSHRTDERIMVSTRYMR